MADRTLSWLQRVLLPELSEVKGEIKAIHSEIKRIDGKADSLRNEMSTNFEAVDLRFDSLSTTIAGLEKRMDVADRLTRLESEVSQLKAKA